jgi:hypothetical protein
MVFSDEYLAQVKFFTCIEKQFHVGDRIKTVFKLHYKQWWKPTKTIKFNWVVVDRKQYESYDASQLRACLNTYFGSK